MIQPKKITKAPMRTFAKSMPLKAKKVMPMKRAKTVAFSPTASKTTMMKRVRKSGVPASKKAGMIRQISRNKI